MRRFLDGSAPRTLGAFFLHRAFPGAAWSGELVLDPALTPDPRRRTGSPVPASSFAVPSSSGSEVSTRGFSCTARTRISAAGCTTWATSFGSSRGALAVHEGGASAPAAVASACPRGEPCALRAQALPAGARIPREGRDRAWRGDTRCRVAGGRAQRAGHVASLRAALRRARPPRARRSRTSREHPADAARDRPAHSLGARASASVGPRPPVDRDPEGCRLEAPLPQGGVDPSTVGSPSTARASASGKN